MNIRKKTLRQLHKCYAVTTATIGGTAHILFATEGEGGCYAYSGDSFDTETTVWEGPGGTMSIVPIPGCDGEFLAIQKFFRLYDWEEAEIVWVTKRAGAGFDVKTVVNLPYIHRFDILPANGKNYFIGCTLAEKKATRDDWSSPGKIYVGELPAGPDLPLRLSVLKDDITCNHGYFRCDWKGRPASLVAGREGVFAITPPHAEGGEWGIESVLARPVSDIALQDIDGDGEYELATIEPFHGSYFRVYKKTGDAYAQIFEHEEVSEFYHVVQSGTLRGKPVFIGGCRRGKQQLFYVECVSKRPLQLKAVVIEEGVGPSNALVLNQPTRDVIVSANREKGEAALYFVED